MRITRHKKSLHRSKKGLILVSIGLFFLLLSLFLKGYLEIRNCRQEPDLSNLSFEIEENNLPERIIIPRLKINLAVSWAKVLENNWSISTKGVSYLIDSGIPGKIGNAVIYGHNKRAIFGPIRWLRKDDKITIINKKGEEFTYVVVETKVVAPAAVEILLPTSDATLTLYTCTGYLDKERFIVIAKLGS